MGTIIQEVCNFYALTIGEVTMKGRRREAASARQVIVFLAREKGVTTTAIGRTLSCCHSYCAYCCRVVRERMEVYEDFRADVDRLRKAIEGKEERRAS